MKINQLIHERNATLYKNGFLFFLLIGVALIIDQKESGLFFTIVTAIIKLSSLYGLMLLARRMRDTIKCPCCDGDITSDVYKNTSSKHRKCPFCLMRFDQDSAPYKRRLADIQNEREMESVDEDFLDEL